MVGFNGGRVQINHWIPAPYTDFMFIDAMKMCLLPWVALNSANNEVSTEDWRLLFNARDYPTRMPNVAGDYWRSSQLWIYGVAGDVWVLDWANATSTLDLQAFFGGGGLTQNIISGTRREYTLTGDPDGGALDAFGSPNPALLVAIRITAMAANDFASGHIRLYKKTHESLLSAGGLMNPDFKDRANEWGVQRFMDLQQVILCNTGKWADRKTIDERSHLATRLKSSLWCGTSTGTNDQVVGQPSSTISSWTDGQIAQWKMGSVPLFKTVTAISNENPGKLTITGHGYSNGNKVEFDYWTVPGGAGGTWGAAFNNKSLTVTVVDADRITLGVDTTSYGTYPGGFKLYKQLSLKVGSLAAVPICRLNGYGFYSDDFVAGQEMTGTYNALLSKVLVNGSQNDNHHIIAGCPVEVLVMMANELGCHPHFCLPMLATDDYVTQFATYVRDNLSAGLIPKYTYANEIWNFGQQITSLANALAAAHPTLASANYHLWYGLRLVQMADLIAAVYSGSGKSYEMVLELQAADIPTPTTSPTTEDRFKCPPYSAGDTSKYPVNKCHAIAPAGYYYPAFAGAPNAASYGGYVNSIYAWKHGDPTTAFNWLRDQFRNNSTDGGFPTQWPLKYLREVIWPAWKAQANIYSKLLYEYEGGLGVFGPNGANGGFPAVHSPSGETITTTDVYNYWIAYMGSTQHAENVVKHAQDFVDAGGKFPSQYTLAGPWGAGALWALYGLNDFANGPTPAYTNLLAFNNSRTVTYTMTFAG